MKKTEVILTRKPALMKTEDFMKEYQTRLNKSLNEGYEIKASNMTIYEATMFFYVLLEKEE